MEVQRICRATVKASGYLEMPTQKFKCVDERYRRLSKRRVPIQHRQLYSFTEIQRSNERHRKQHFCQKGYLNIRILSRDGAPVFINIYCDDPENGESIDSHTKCDCE